VFNESKKEFIAIGRRKTAIANITLRPGRGILIIRKSRALLKLSDLYLQNNPKYINAIETPFKLCGLSAPGLLKFNSSFDVYVNVQGGGLNSQSEAIKLAISRALCQISDQYELLLKYNGLLTCDSRIKERKKYGLKKARKASQYSKR